MNRLNVEFGDRIKFKRERNSYLVRTADERFIVAVKPYNPKRTFQYTIKEKRG